MDYVEWFFIIVGALVTFASTIVAVLEKSSSVTPYTKDDERVATYKKWLGFVSFFMDKFSVVNIKKSE